MSKTIVTLPLDWHLNGHKRVNAGVICESDKESLKFMVGVKTGAMKPRFSIKIILAVSP